MTELFDDLPHVHDPAEPIPRGTVRFEVPYGTQKQCPLCHEEMLLLHIDVTDDAEVTWFYQCPMHGVHWSVRLQP